VDINEQEVEHAIHNIVVANPGPKITVRRLQDVLARLTRSEHDIERSIGDIDRMIVGKNGTFATRLKNIRADLDNLQTNSERGELQDCMSRLANVINELENL
jgi:hypothetical protein